MPPSIVPPVGRVAQKWARRASAASGDYADGVQNTTRSWQAAAQAAEKNYQAGVQQAAAAGRFGKGVARVGDSKWKKRAVEVGPARYSQGVSIAEQDYSAQVAPFLEVIGRTDLPPRGPAGSDGNFQRVMAIGKALRQLKVSR
jgi:hypothetical protein